MKSLLGQGTNGSRAILAGHRRKDEVISMYLQFCGLFLPYWLSLLLVAQFILLCLCFSLGQKQRDKKVSLYLFQLFFFFTSSLVCLISSCHDLFCLPPAHFCFSCLFRLRLFLVFCNPGQVRGVHEGHVSEDSVTAQAWSVPRAWRVPFLAQVPDRAPVVGSSLGWALGVPVARLQSRTEPCQCSKGELGEKSILESFFCLLMLVRWEGKCRPEPTEGLLADRVNHRNNQAFQPWRPDYVTLKIYHLHNSHCGRHCSKCFQILIYLTL